ncbi:GNAT family N-acetyltransferase [Halomicrobium salinisoli]|uniref:GNAT family N-acetyltransferase n=1 Tax=Halomicrobium salinisoli TaxID=2878391 RepID=UPI001CF072D9|nr:GNAT family N-acetyltransferase [Halomicrobium salinisoli]
MDRQLRPATPADAAAIRDIYAPFVESTAVTFEVEPPTVDETADRIESTLERYPWLVCEAAGDVVGYAAASRLRSKGAYQWTVELSVYVAEGSRQSGVGTALYESLFALLARQGFCDAYAATTLPNPATEALHERTGFEPVGTFPAVGYKGGEWRDVRWWHRQLRERPADPDPPTPLPDLNDDAVDAALDVGRSSLDD